MNEILQAMKTRHAIRRFQDKQLDDATLNAILEAGLYAPSAGNNQYSRIVVCQDSEVNEKLGRINRWMQFKGKDPATVEMVCTTVANGGQVFVKAAEAAKDGTITPEEKVGVGDALTSTITTLVPQERIDEKIEEIRSALLFV